MPSNKTLNEKKKKQKRQGKKRPLKGVIFSRTISQVMFPCLEMLTQIPMLLYRKVKPFSLSPFRELGKNFKSGVNINLSPDHIANPSL